MNHEITEIAGAATELAGVKLIRQALCALRLRREPCPARYGAEVLLAGWVELPAAFRELAAERGRTRFATRFKSN